MRVCVVEIIGNVQALQSLTVDRSLEQERQKAEAKHILVQKQRALADLFKMLAQIGQCRSNLIHSRSLGFIYNNMILTQTSQSSFLSDCEK